MTELKLVNDAQNTGIKPASTAMLDRTDSGNVKATLKNTAIILQSDNNLKGLLRYNEFSQKIDVVEDKEINVTGLLPLTLEKGQLKDSDEQSILTYLASSSYQVQPTLTTLEVAIGVTAHAFAYNPVVDYMNEAAEKWDKKPRLKGFLHKYLGADESKVNELSFKLWLLGAVAKAYDPYTKFDYVLDLVGGQGVGKTTLLKDIAQLDDLNTYTDQFEGFSGRDDKSAFAGCLIANDDEMTASNNSSFEEVKKFITTQEFAYRPAYAHHVQKFHKGFVLARTSNEVQHLKDRSGDRRFLSIECNADQQEKHPVVYLKAPEIKQLWGEVVNLYKQYKKKGKNPFDLSKEEQEILSQGREKFRQTTEVEDALNGLFDGQYKNRQFIPAYELKTDMCLALGHSPSRKEMSSIRYLMGHKNFLAGQLKYDPASKSMKRGFLKPAK
ncbi:VapE domain-containing protein [Lactobacillus crispatus]|uniref:VapE domain-containing protein n=1 Tax=Lactobacillus crispatus TaxID=47770 RepID=UPI0030F658E1